MRESHPRRTASKVFDGTFNVGHVLVICGLLLSAGASYTAALVLINGHELRLKMLENTLPRLDQLREDLSHIRSDMAVIRERVSRVLTDRANADKRDGSSQQ